MRKLVFLLSVFLILATQAKADWVPISTGLPLNPANNAGDIICGVGTTIVAGVFGNTLTAITGNTICGNVYAGNTITGTIFSSWVENSNVFAKYWNGTTWLSIGESLNIIPGADVHNPDIKTLLGIPVATWSEHAGVNFQTYCKYYNGTQWINLGSALNSNPQRDALQPRIALTTATAYTCWQERNLSGDTGNYDIFVKHWNGSTWIALGGALDVTVARKAAHPDIVYYNGTPFVSWEETSVSNTKIYVKYWNGASWQLAGGQCLNRVPTRSASEARLLVKDDKLFVLWSERSAANWDQLYLNRFNGSSWTPVGNSINEVTTLHANNGSLSYYNGTPFVAFRQTNGAINNPINDMVIKYYNGSSWVLHPGNPFINKTNRLSNPEITHDAEGKMYVAWSEFNGTLSHIYASVFTEQKSSAMVHAAASNMSIATSTFTPSPTTTPTPTPVPPSLATATATSTPTTTATVVLEQSPIKVVTAYPLPAKDNLWILVPDAGDQPVNLSFFSISGERVLSVDGKVDGQNRIHVGVSHLAPGLYYYVLKINGEKKVTKKIAIQ